MVAHLEDERHSYFSMELDVTVEQPVAGIVRDKPNYSVATVRDGDRVFLGRARQPPLQLALLVQLLDVLKGDASI